MTQKANFFKLGLFVILAFALTAAMLIAFGAGRFLKTEILAETYFNESVQGLDIGSEVKYKGVKIGTVKSITTPAKVYGVPSNYVLVVFALAEDCYVGQTGEDAGERMKKAIDEGLTIFLSFKGLTGAAYLETDYQSPQSPPDITWHPQNLYVPSRKSNIKRIGDAMNQMLDNLSELNVEGISGNLAGLVEVLNKKANALNMAEISDQTEALLKELRQTNAKLADLIGSEQTARLLADASASLSDLRAMVRDARTPLANTLQHTETATARISRMTEGLETEYGPKAESLIRRMDTLMANLEKTSGFLESMVWTNSDTVSKAVENLEFTSENLNQLILELRKYPGRILTERPPASDTPQGIKEKINADE